MEKEKEQQKEKIIEIIGYEKFNDLCRFAEEVYLYDAELIVLMARKMACLFMLFNEFVKEKYDLLELEYKNKNGAKIITDRAFPLYKKAINDGKYKKVVIVDDVVKHGRTILDLYKSMASPDITCEVFCYVRSEEKLIGELQTVTGYFHENDARHLNNLVDDIVNIINGSGASYVSSVPPFDYYLNVNDEDDHFPEDRYPENRIQNEDLTRLDISATAYDVMEDVPAEIQSYCEAAYVRVYRYRQLGKMKIIPYVLLKPGRAEYLNRAFDLSSLFSEKYKKLCATAEEEDLDEIKCREREYVLSLCAGNEFLKKHGLLDKCELDSHIEEYNFGTAILSKEWQTMSFSEIKVKDVYKEMDGIPELPDESRELYDNFVDIIRQYDGFQNKPMETWQGGEFDLAKDLLGRTLAVNSRKDDSKCRAAIQQKREIDGKKLLGIPVYKMVKTFKDYFPMTNPFPALIGISDYGQGSIIHRRTKNRYDIAFLFSGEHNFKHYEISNFPALYGMYVIDKRAEGTDEEKRKIKEEFIGDYKAFMAEKNIFFLEKEIDGMADIDVSGEYGLYIMNNVQKYKNNDCLEYVENTLRNKIG